MSLHVSLTPELERWVREKVEQGLYSNASEVVREALRLLVKRDRQGEFLNELRRLGREDRKRPSSRDDLADRLREALELLRLSSLLIEQNLRRDHPEASDAEIDELLATREGEADWGEVAPGYLERSPERLEKLLRDAD